MKKILKWFNYSNRTKFQSIVYHLYKKIFIYLKKNNQKILDSIHFDYLNTNTFRLSESEFGKFIIFAKDGGISRQVYINKTYNFETLNKAIQILGKVDIIFDIGANIGTTCITAIKKKFSKTAIAIEVDNENFELLRQNIILNKMEDKIKSFNAAIGYKQKKIDLIKNKNNFGANYTKNSNDFKKKNKVKVIHLNKFDKFTKKKSLVWIDVQGNEANALLGSTKLIKKKIPFVIEFWPYGINRAGNKEKLIKQLLKFKFFIDLKIKKKNKIDCNIKNLNELFKKYRSKKATELLLMNT